MKKILVSIPCARFIEPECFESLYSQRIPAKHKTELFIPQNYSIDVSRNMTAHYAVENNFDYILFVDSDIVLPKNAITKLASHDKDVVSGVYAYKQLLRKEVVVKVFGNEEKKEYRDLKDTEIVESQTRLLKVDAFGFGCVLVKTEVIKKIDYPYFVFTQEMGEDVYFCRKAQNAGYELFVDTKVLCGHKGEVNYNIRG